MSLFLKEKKITEVLDLTCEIQIQIFVMKYSCVCDLESIAEIKDGSRLNIIRVVKEIQPLCQTYEKKVIITI